MKSIVTILLSFVVVPEGLDTSIIAVIAVVAVLLLAAAIISVVWYKKCKSGRAGDGVTEHSNDQQHEGIVHNNFIPDTMMDTSNNETINMADTNTYDYVYEGRLRQSNPTVQDTMQ